MQSVLSINIKLLYLVVIFLRSILSRENAIRIYTIHINVNKEAVIVKQPGTRFFNFYVSTKGYLL